MPTLTPLWQRGGSCWGPAGRGNTTLALNGCVWALHPTMQAVELGQCMPTGAQPTGAAPLTSTVVLASMRMVFIELSSRCTSHTIFPEIILMEGAESAMAGRERGGGVDRCE
jgi:hypothetical protein